MQQLIALKFVLACIEETLKSLLMVKKEFDIELFKLVFKKNIYEILSDDDYTIGIEEIMKKSCINFDLANDQPEDILEDDAENYEITIDIPMSSIITAVKNMIGRGEVDDVYNERDLMRDNSLIEDIWKNWIPVDDFANLSKEMSEYMLENLLL